MNNLVALGLGREAAFAASLLGDNGLMEKVWQDTGMLAEAVLHAHVRTVLCNQLIPRLSTYSITSKILPGTWTSNYDEHASSLEPNATERS